jgi:hypothetical protein
VLRNNKSDESKFGGFMLTVTVPENGKPVEFRGNYNTFGPQGVSGTVTLYRIEDFVA